MAQLALYSGASGMENEQVNLDIIANNLANLNTPGFKEFRADFTDLLYQQLRPSGADAGAGETAPTGIELGNGSQLVGTTKKFTQGHLQHTGNELDIAIDGDGFLEVTMPDGTQAYTRAGSLKVNSQNQVTTASGLVIGSGFQSIPSGAKVSISNNGYVTAEIPGGTSTTFRITLTRFTNPPGLKSIGNNLLVETPASGSPETGNPAENGFGVIKQSHIEKSNVDAVRSMVNLIVAQRSYELNSKSIQTADQMLSDINSIKR